MSGFFNKIDGMHAFLDILSWKKIFQLAAFLFVLTLAWGTYEMRESIYNYVNQSKISRNASIVQKLSKKSISEVDTAEQKSDLIVAIQIVVIDFQRNVRTPIYTSTANIALKELYERFVDTSITDIPLFSGDIVNNKQLVELINGEFTCYPFSDTIVAKLLPESGKYIHTACAVGIPPYYGKFSGAVLVFLKRQPTVDEVDQIRGMAKTLSSNIYERDFR